MHLVGYISEDSN